MSIIFTWAYDVRAFFILVMLMFSIECFGISFLERAESTMIHRP
jgi:hypothetical protein